jgi:hypothetical protein
MLQPGDLVPHFDVRSLEGARMSYSSSIWQARNLLLIALRGGDRDSIEYAETIKAHEPELTAGDTALVVTSDDVPGVDAPAVVIADQWGEVIHSQRADRGSELPAPGEIARWLTFVRHQCPECQGEAK